MPPQFDFNCHFFFFFCVSFFETGTQVTQAALEIYYETKPSFEFLILLWPPAPESWDIAAPLYPNELPLSIKIKKDFLLVQYYYLVKKNSNDDKILRQTWQQHARHLSTGTGRQEDQKLEVGLGMYFSWYSACPAWKQP